ncbi:MAG: hypothetical protein D6725_02060, partial [Planctomycetota bacterium]
QSASLDRVTDTARREMHALNEFRTRLIADVVTGKLDVREVAARLPDPDPLAEDDSIEELETDEEPPAEDELSAEQTPEHEEAEV